MAATKTLQQVLGENLRRWRKDRDMSQEELAEFLAMHRTYVGGIEQGRRNLTLQSVERLAEGLGVEPLELLASVAE